MKNPLKMIAGVMLIVAIIFVIYACNHPEMTFPWSPGVTYLYYGLYIGVMIILFIVPFHPKK